CEPIKDLWFEEAVSLGRINAPGFFADDRIKQAYTRVTWTGDSQGSIDPEKEVSAAERRIALGISTIEKESILYDGGDWEANITQRAKEKQLMDDLGLNDSGDVVNVPSMPPQS
ncbi:phage portal protein, partial [Candidatus Kaiserbacteria bacterium]|nr:phage portal protein [Candidatus Kaiserbacteria bacterium]